MMYLHFVFSKPGTSWLVLFLSILATHGCSEQESTNTPPLHKSEWLPGGTTTVVHYSRPRFDLPSANLPAEFKTDFHAGKALAQQPWVKAPTATDSRDGLGPIYNARTCMACHIKGGKGNIPSDGNAELFSSLVRLSKPGQDKTSGVVPHPAYGDQIQTQSTSLAHQLRHMPSAQSIPKDVQAEAYVFINWKTKVVQYPDNQKVMLKHPTPVFKHLAYGELEKKTLISLRTAPMIHGMGLIELIPQSQINALIDTHDSNRDGISGRINQVWDSVTKTTVAGRFGLKANKATLTLTVAGAFANDLGISNPLVQTQPCTHSQKTCLLAANGNDENGVELNQSQLDRVVFFNRNLAPLSARNLDKKEVIKGRSLFYDTGCNQCHNPSFTTGAGQDSPHLSHQVIWPYSDFLLHDMGKELADNRPDFQASGQEWRTPPLWGIGLREAVNGSQSLLHDGRANTIEEAILWHGGEAQASKKSFMELGQTDRENLILFVESI
jgi:CxxC motif-containing protein (DUF1111 family)